MSLQIKVMTQTLSPVFPQVWPGSLTVRARGTPHWWPMLEVKQGMGTVLWTVTSCSLLFSAMWSTSGENWGERNKSLWGSHWEMKLNWGFKTESEEALPSVQRRNSRFLLKSILCGWSWLWKSTHCRRTTGEISAEAWSLNQLVLNHFFIRLNNKARPQNPFMVRKPSQLFIHNYCFLI